MQNSMLSEIHPQTLDQVHWRACELPRPAPSTLLCHVSNLSLPQVNLKREMAVSTFEVDRAGVLASSPPVHLRKFLQVCRRLAVHQTRGST
jgi:hypothetical protein